MATYTQQTWRDYPSGGTPISAARLTHIEAGIAAAGDGAAAASAQATANTALSTANAALTAANNAQSDIDTFSATFEPLTGGFTAATGWSEFRNKIIKIGRVASCDVAITRTGGTITVGSSGNITNTLVGTVTSAFTNWGLTQGLTTGGGGSLNSVYITGNSVYLAAYVPSVNINNGDQISFAGPWITAS